MILGRDLNIDLTARELAVITEVLRDAHDDPTRQWSEAWHDRVRPVRARFDRLQRLLNEAEVLNASLECEGVKLS